MFDLHISSVLMDTEILMPRLKYFKRPHGQDEFPMGQYVDEFDMTFLGPSSQEGQVHCKKGYQIPRPSRDVTNQTLPGRK